MNDSNAIKDLELQARNTKAMMDKLNKALYGFTVDELIKMALEGKQDGKEVTDE